MSKNIHDIIPLVPDLDGRTELQTPGTGLGHLRGIRQSAAACRRSQPSAGRRTRPWRCSGRSRRRPQCARRGCRRPWARGTGGAAGPTPRTGSANSWTPCSHASTSVASTAASRTTAGRCPSRAPRRVVARLGCVCGAIPLPAPEPVVFEGCQSYHERCRTDGEQWS